MKKQGIIECMALLREQKSLLRLIYDLDTSSLGESDDVVIGAIMGSVPEVDLLKYLAQQQVFEDDAGKTFGSIQDNRPEFIKRHYRVATLFQSCKDDKFIEPSVLSGGGQTHELGVRITSRGSDLLHPLGMAKVFLEKYDKVSILLVSSLTSTGVTAFIAWLLTIILK